MQPYLKLLDHVLTHGVKRIDRTGVGTISTFGEQIKFDLRDGFPAVTTKELKLGQVAAELEAFLKGYHTLEDLHSVGCKIWDQNGTAPYWVSKATALGDLGPIYGVQWRRWQGYKDQIEELVQDLRANPWSRRHVVTAWNPADTDKMCLPPCHILFQCYVIKEDGIAYLDLRVDMRSVDLFLGMPFDVASYAILMHLIGHSTGLVPRILTFQTGDTHIYLNHLDQVTLQLAREPYPLPVLDLPLSMDVNNFTGTAVKLLSYQHHPFIKGEMAI